MNLTVIIPSRGRVLGLSAVLYALAFFASGKHAITYAIACDDDDPETIRFLEILSKDRPIVFKAGPRRSALGEAINEMADFCPGDVYCLINDDVLPMTDEWDEVIAKAVQKTPHGVFWWKSGCPQQVYFPIITEKWRNAAGGLFTTHFPFWYDDLCLLELWLMTTDSDNILLDIWIGDKPATVTHRMRELKFWQQVYIRSRIPRIKQAREIAEKLGLPRPQSSPYVAALMGTHLKTVPDWWIAQIEKNQGDLKEPDESYLRAKKRAQKMLDETPDKIDLAA